MKREAWEAMNSAVIKGRPEVSHQTISDDIVESLHKAGFVIVPHEITNEMLTDAGPIGDCGLKCLLDADYRSWYSAMTFVPIRDRQESE